MNNGKIAPDLQSLVKTIASLKRQGRTIVFTNGCFDLFHYGHLASLQRAKQLGDILVVGINNDASVKKIKGPNRPLIPCRERTAIVAALTCVDYCIPFSGKTPARIIAALKPDILAKGAEYRNKPIVGEVDVKRRGGRIVLLPMVKNISTSVIAKRIKRIS